MSFALSDQACDEIEVARDRPGRHSTLHESSGQVEEPICNCIQAGML